MTSNLPRPNWSIIPMSNETITETAEPNALLTRNFITGVVNLTLFFPLLYLFIRYNNSFFGLPFDKLSIHKMIFHYGIWIFFYVIYTLAVSSFEKNSDRTKAFYITFVNRFSKLLMVISILLFACWIYFRKSVLSYFIITYSLSLVFSSMISVILVSISMLFTEFCHSFFDYDLPVPSDYSNEPDYFQRNRFLGANWRFVVDIWRQLVIFMVLLATPLTFFVIISLLAAGKAFLVVSWIFAVVLVYFVLIQFTYIVFNVVMRRIYAWIGNRIEARE